MPNEYVSLCGCKLTGLRREADEIIAELRCPVQREEAPGEAPEAPAGEAAEHRAKAPAAKVLRQVSESAPGKVLLQK